MCLSSLLYFYVLLNAISLSDSHRNRTRRKRGHRLQTDVEISVGTTSLSQIAEHDEMTPTPWNYCYCHLGGYYFPQEQMQQKFEAGWEGTFLPFPQDAGYNDLATFYRLRDAFVRALYGDFDLDNPVAKKTFDSEENKMQNSEVWRLYLREHWKVKELAPEPGDIQPELVDVLRSGAFRLASPVSYKETIKKWDYRMGPVTCPDSKSAYSVEKWKRLPAAKVPVTFHIMKDKYFHEASFYKSMGESFDTKCTRDCKQKVRDLFTYEETERDDDLILYRWSNDCEVGTGSCPRQVECRTDKRGPSVKGAPACYSRSVRCFVFKHLSLLGFGDVLNQAPALTNVRNALAYMLGFKNDFQFPTVQKIKNTPGGVLEFWCCECDTKFVAAMRKICKDFLATHTCIEPEKKKQSSGWR